MGNHTDMHFICTFYLSVCSLLLYDSGGWLRPYSKSGCCASTSTLPIFFLFLIQCTSAHFICIFAHLWNFRKSLMSDHSGNRHCFKQINNSPFYLALSSLSLQLLTLLWGFWVFVGLARLKVVSLVNARKFGFEHASNIWLLIECSISTSFEYPTSTG